MPPASTPPDQPTVPPNLAAFGVDTVTVDSLRWLVAVADLPEERFQGLREVDDLGDLDGMIFEYEDEGTRSFTMATVPIPLQIGIFDGSGRLIEVIDMAPCPSGEGCPVYTPSAPFRWAIETRPGWWADTPPGSLLVREN